MGGVRLGSSVQICATSPSDARQPERPTSAKQLIHPSHEGATGKDLAAALSQLHGPEPDRETSFNIPLTLILPVMDGAHKRLVNLEATAYRCLSRAEAQRILQEAAELSGGLQSPSCSVTPLHRQRRAA